MNWLAPLFLVGALAVVLPIWLHRLQTETPKRQAFASAMLLLSAERRVHVEKRLRYWLLLALRILFLLLLCFSFAKPLWQRPPAALNGAAAQLQVLLLDSSLSMHEGSRWASAVSAAQQLIDNAAPQDRLELLAAGDELVHMIGPINATAEGKQAVRDALAKLHSGVSQLQYGAMMNGVQALLADETQATQLHVISDFQQSELPAQFGDLVPRAVNGRVMQVQLHSVADGIKPNFAIAAVERVGDGVEVTVQGFNTPEQDVTVQLRVNDAVKATQTKRIPASGVTVVSFDRIALNTGSNKVQAELKAVDDIAADDVFYAVFNNSVGQPVPFLSVKPDSVTGKYLDAALVAAGNRYRLQSARIDQFDARTLDRYRFVLVDDLGAVSNALAKQLREYLEQGGAVFAAVGERSLTLKTLPVVNLPVNGALSTDADRVSVGAVDVNHAALTNAAGLRALNMTRYLSVKTDAQSRTLAQLDNGSPLLIEQRIGQGRVLLFTSSLDNTWNDLPVQPVFVSLLSDSARYLAGETLLKRAQRVGDSLPLDQAAAAGQVVDPSGRNLLSLSDSQRARSVKLSDVGYYQVVTAGSSTLVAVNTVPDESNLMPMSDDEIGNWRDALTEQQQSVASAASVAQQKPNGLELWHWLLILMGLLVLAESLLGNTYVQRRVETAT
jgi:hypothetical protein